MSAGKDLSSIPDSGSRSKTDAAGQSRLDIAGQSRLDCWTDQFMQDSTGTSKLEGDGQSRLGSTGQSRLDILGQSRLENADTSNEGAGDQVGLRREKTGPVMLNQTTTTSLDQHAGRDNATNYSLVDIDVLQNVHSRSNPIPGWFTLRFW